MCLSGCLQGISAVVRLGPSAFGLRCALLGNRALCHLHLEEPKRAIRDCQAVLVLDATNLKAYTREARGWMLIYKQAGISAPDQKEALRSARSCLATVLELEPSNKTASELLTELAELETMAKIMKIATDAQVSHQLGMTSQAHTEYTEAIEAREQLGDGSKLGAGLLQSLNTVGCVALCGRAQCSLDMSEHLRCGHAHTSTSPLLNVPHHHVLCPHLSPDRR